MLVFDFDGALARLTPDRAQAALRPRTLALFATLSARYPCAVLSLRQEDDVRGRLGGAPVRQVVGGFDEGAAYARFVATMMLVRETLDRRIDGRYGIRVKELHRSIVVDFGAAQRKTVARNVVLTAIATLDVPVQVTPGRTVVDVALPDVPEKRAALRRLCEEPDIDHVLYVSDDMKRDDCPDHDEAPRLLTVRVEHDSDDESAARFSLLCQEAVDDLLARLVVLRHGTP